MNLKLHDIVRARVQHYGIPEMAMGKVSKILTTGVEVEYRLRSFLFFERRKTRFYFNETKHLFVSKFDPIREGEMTAAYQSEGRCCGGHCHE